MKLSCLLPVLSLCMLLKSSLSHSHHHDHHHHHHYRFLQDGEMDESEILPCNATAMGEKDMEIAERVYNEFMANGGRRQLQGTINIPVYWHIITTTDNTGFVRQASIDRSMDLLNAAFSPDFQFSLAATNYVQNNDWFTNGLQSGSASHRAMTSSLRQGGSGTLNLYTTNTPPRESGILLGMATFPRDYTSMPEQDGCVIFYLTMPGGPSATHSLGGTTIHEGDQVTDTPAQAEPTSGCPFFPPDTCTSAGRDPIENFMDYSDDTCKSLDDGFTEGQFNKMLAEWNAYRAGDTVVNPPPEMTPITPPGEVSVYVEFAYDRFPFETSWSIRNSAGQAVVNYPRGTGRGILAGTIELAPGLYTIEINDSEGDGTCCAYGFGYYFIAIEGVNVVSQSFGNFGDRYTDSFRVGSTAGFREGNATLEGNTSGLSTQTAATLLATVLLLPCFLLKRFL